MTMRRHLRRLLRPRRAGDDRGTALVESGLILPVVSLIIFAVIEFGFLFATAQTTNSSSRAGARSASQIYALAPGAASADKVRDAVVTDLLNLDGGGTPVEMWIYDANAAGDYSGDPTFTTCGADCIRYTGWNGSTFTARSGTWQGASGEGNPDACGATIDSVGVYVKVEHDFFTGFLADKRMVAETAVMRFEPKQDSSCPAGST